MTTRTTTMTKTMKTTIRLAALCMLLCVGTSFGGVRSSDVVNTDWLDLVRRYTSADEVSYEGSKWDNLVSSYSGTKPVNPLAEWWGAFGDERLTQLVELAFTNNKDMAVARARVLEARAQVGVTLAGMSPKADGGGGVTHSRASEHTTGGGSSTLYRIGLDASWELDFFGKKAEDLRGDKIALAGQEASLQSVWVSLSAEVATNYINLRTLQERLRIAEKNIAVQKDIYELVKSQYSAGLRDELSVQQAGYTLERTRSGVPSIVQSISETMNALAVLTGEVPGSLNEFLSVGNDEVPLPQVDMTRLIGIPAEALRQRPDVRAAEMTWLAQSSRKKSAEKSYYPVISLLGSIGLESLSTGNFLEGGSHTFSIGPRITWPIFNSGAIRKDIRIQSAREEQYFAAYEASILKAVGEVRNALEANAQEAERNILLRRGLEAARSALDIARDKYIQGLIPFSEVLTAMQSVYSLEDDCTVSDGRKMMNVIALFKALGGGWEPFTRQK
ncbi:MAG: TolC family protein [Synergistaceae bacterium]|nr:TolC family protein [Synergistaceae bacterium]